MPHPNGPAHEMGDARPPKAKLEERYIVLKNKDVEKLSKRDQATLSRLCEKVRDIREARGAMRFGICLVVERDWPEYVPTLGAILSRVDRENSAAALGVKCTACRDTGWIGTDDDRAPCMACADGVEGTKNG